MSNGPIDPLSGPKYVLEGRIVTMAPGPDSVIPDGSIYVDAGEIKAVQPAAAPTPPGFEDAPRIRTGDSIYPGLIELHNHLSYNAIPLWDVPRRFTNLSHHQYYSQFESRHERAARQLSELIGRPVLWFWGHEHRLAIYGKHATVKGRLEAYGRCLGHGGLPIEDVMDFPKHDRKHKVGPVIYDGRVRTTIGRDQTPVGFNGFAILSFDGKDLTVEYRDGEGDRALLRERWQVESGGTLRGVSMERLSEDEDLRLHAARLEDAVR